MSVQKVKEIISQRGWCKGSMEKTDGSVCLLGAARAAHVQEERNPGWHYSPAITALSKVIQEQYPERVTGATEEPIPGIPWVGDYDHVWIFNDHADTTYEDIERVLEKAAVEES